MASPSMTFTPPFGGYSSLRRFSVAEYHQMIQAAVLDEDDSVELLEGYVVLKMTRKPPHDCATQVVGARLRQGLPSGWCDRIQAAITLSDSEPEPDIALVRGSQRKYASQHPTVADIGLVVEVADSSLDRDRTDKARIYARAGIAVYWIVNLVDGQVEVFTDPSGPCAVPAYARRQDFLPGASVPLILDGQSLSIVAVTDLLP